MIRVQTVNRIIDQVRMNPSVRLDLGSAAALAGYAPHHFHRMFAATAGETLQQFAGRNRLANAARVLGSGWKGSLLELALGCGFNSAEDFSRQFRARFECSPREVQKGARICVNRSRLLRRDRIVRVGKTDCHAFIRKIRVEELPALDVVYGRVFGAMENPDAVKDVLRKLFAWATRFNHLDFKQPIQMVGIGWDNFDITPYGRFIYDAGIVIQPGRPLVHEPWMNYLKIPGRKYVVMDFEGDLGDEEDAFDYLRSWMVRNGYFQAVAPGFEVFSNERSLHDWNHFKIKLVVPISCSPLLT
jgi:AraC family transcriptional regulator